MREILFRGKRVDNGEWVEGFYTCFCIDGTIIARIERASGRVYVNPVDYITVDEETVGQFTGVTDKNGKKIFEGDIVEFDGDCKRDVVIWGNGEDNGVSGFRLKRYPLFSVTMSNHNLFEVIGNIHDNHELLK